MSMEELNKVAEIISSLSDKGGDAFIWYLSYKVFDSLMCLTAMIGSIVAVGKIILACIDRNNAAEEKKRKTARVLEEIRAHINYGKREYSQGWIGKYDYEDDLKDEIIQIIANKKAE